MDVDPIVKSAINRLVSTLLSEGISTISDKRIVTSLEDHDLMSDAFKTLGIDCEITPHPSMPPGSVVIAPSGEDFDEDEWF